MRILSITAGAAGMYCGSCIRDNTLAAELMALGHEVTLLPLYTPLLTDEPNVSEHRVFFGGISVYLQQKVPLLRHTPAVLDRIWDAPAVINAAAGRSVTNDPRQLGELTVSVLRGEEGNQGKELRKLVDWLRGQPRPDVISLPNSLLLSLARPLGEALQRPVFCTLQGEDLFLDGLREPFRGQALELVRRHAPAATGFLAVSDYYARFMVGYLGIPRDKIRVVPLGINLAGHDPSPRPRSGPYTVGYFARVAPEKGLHVLAEAYRRLREGGVEARLEAAGYLAPEHKPYLEGIAARMAEWGLRDGFHYRGVLDRAGKIAFLRGLDVLSVPSVYAEPKGLYLLEAMANAVPVVQPRRGAFPEMLEKTGGGLLVEADDPASLAQALRRLHDDPVLAAELGRRGAEGVRRHYSARAMAEAALEVYASTHPRAARAV